MSTIKIFCDFDDVLFDTKNFTVAMKEIVMECGITAQEYDATYQKARLSQSVPHYVYTVHLDILVAEHDLDRDRVDAAVQKILTTSGQYLFSDTRDFLAAAQEIADLYLVTCGAPAMQESKVSYCAIDQFFTEQMIGNIDKAQEIARFYHDGDVAYFIDDRVAHLAHVKSAHSGITTILLARPGGRYEEIADDNVDHTAHSLEAILSLIH